MGYIIDNSYLNREVEQEGVAPLQKPQSYEEMVLKNANWGYNVGDKIGKFSRKYDTQIGDISSMNQEDVDSERARVQTAMDRIGNAAINNLAIAGSTAIGSSLGFVYGLFDALSNGEIDRIWNNEVTNAVDEFQKGVQEDFTIYRNKDFQNQSIWKKLGTSVFWADLIQNMGYSEGMLIPGIGTSKLLTSAPKIVQKIGGALAGALTEASTEAIQAKNNKIEEERRSLDMNYNKLYLQASSDEERQMLSNSYIEALNRINEDSIKAGNFVFGYNTALLTCTNLIEWNNLFSRGNKSALKNSSKLRKEIAAQKSKGITFDTNKNQFNIEGKGLTIAGEVGRKALDVFSEGFEEVSQDIGQNTAFNNSDYSTFNDMELNPIYVEKADGVLNSFTQALSEAMKDPETAYTFSLGAMTSIVGTPSLRRYNTKNNKSFIAPTIEGGVFNFAREIHSNMKDYNIRSKAVEEANALLNNEKIDEMYKGLIRSMSLDDAINTALYNNDSFNYENFKLAKEVSGLITLYNIGHTEILDDIIDKASTMSDEDLQQLIDEGAFGEKNLKLEDAREIVNKNAEDLKKLYNSFSETLTSMEASKQGQKLSKEQKQNFIYGKLQIENWNKRIDGLIDDLFDFHSIFGKQIDREEFRKTILSSQDFLNEFRSMISKFDKSMSNYLNGKNPDYKAITPEYIDEMTKALDDVIRIKKSIYDYSKDMNNVWNNPVTALEESKYELGNKLYEIYKNNIIEQNKKILDKISNPETTFSEFLQNIFINTNEETNSVEVTDSETRNFILDSLAQSEDANITKAVKIIDEALNFIDFVSEEVDNITGQNIGAIQTLNVIRNTEYSNLNDLKKNIINLFKNNAALTKKDRKDILNKIEAYEITENSENKKSSGRESRFLDKGETGEKKENNEGDEGENGDESGEEVNPSQIAFDKMSLKELKDYIYEHNLQDDIPDVNADDLPDNELRRVLIGSIKDYYELNNGEESSDEGDTSIFDGLLKNIGKDEDAGEDESSEKPESKPKTPRERRVRNEDIAEGDEGIYLSGTPEETNPQNGIDITITQFKDPTEKFSNMSGDIYGSEENDMVVLPEDAYSVGRLSPKYDIEEGRKHNKVELSSNWRRDLVIDKVNAGLGTKTATLEDYINSGRLAEKKAIAESQGHKLPIHFIVRRNVENADAFAVSNTLFAAVEEEKEYANITAYNNEGKPHYYRVLGVVSAPKIDTEDSKGDAVKRADPDLKAFKEACREATKDIKTNDDKHHSYTVAPYTSNLEHIFSGRLVTKENGGDKVQRSLKEIVKEEEYKDINIAAKAGDIELTIGDKLEGRNVDININNPNDRSGTIWLKVKEGDGNIYYKNIRLRRFNPEFYNSLKEEERNQNEVLNKIMNLCYVIASNHTDLAVINKALSKLHAYLYIPKNKKITVLTKLGKVSRGKEELFFTNSNKESDIKKDAAALFNLIMKQNYRFSIGIADLTLKQLINSDILTTDLIQVHNINHSFLISEMFPQVTDSGTTVFLPKESEFVKTIDVHTGKQGYIEGKSSSYARIGEASYYKNDDGTYDRIIEEDNGVERRERLNPNKNTDKRTIAIIEAYFTIKNGNAKNNDTGKYLDGNYKHRIYSFQNGSDTIYLTISPETSTNNILTIREVSAKELTELNNEIRKKAKEKNEGKIETSKNRRKRAETKVSENLEEALKGKTKEKKEEIKKPKSKESKEISKEETPKESVSTTNTTKKTNRLVTRKKIEKDSSNISSKYKSTLTKAIQSNKEFIKAVREGTLKDYTGLKSIGQIVDKMIQDKDFIKILSDIEANKIGEEAISQYVETKLKCGN